MDLLPGTLDLLILRALALAPNHGLGISRRIEQMTGGTFQVMPGSLFPALHRLAEQGWLDPEWGESDNARRAKYYKLTASGKKQLREETRSWEMLSAAMSQALRT